MTPDKKDLSDTFIISSMSHPLAYKDALFMLSELLGRLDDTLLLEEKILLYTIRRDLVARQQRLGRKIHLGTATEHDHDLLL